MNASGKSRNGVVVNNDGSNVHITMPGQAVGWGAVENAVREDDERQVLSCKEDIDSLLTFAGLYSAALTALLALSFGMLQEDVAGESLQVLRQIAQQTANYQLLPGGALNTTSFVPPPSSTPFEPSRAALTINILWFSSLVFSMSTASIGILVKQWLRAYTSYQTSSAQGRMRIRHFRRQGLETWKVYEIATLLPFLIQISLGLFFVGLCYFTAEVHPDLGHATLPLVAGWALFIFVVTILPVFSSHCPYKPASMERLFSPVRQQLFSLLVTVFCTLDRLEAWLKRLYLMLRKRFPFLHTALGAVRTLGRWLKQWFTDALRRLLSVLSVAITVLHRCTHWFKDQLNHFDDDQSESDGADAMSITTSMFIGTSVSFTKEVGSFTSLALWARKRTSDCAAIDRPYDEADAVKHAGKDVGILVSADALQSDDELLGTAILDALKQSQPTLEQTAAFLLETLRSRGIPSDGVLRLEDKPTLLDCRSLTLRARSAIVDIVAQSPSTLEPVYTARFDTAADGSSDHSRLADIDGMRWILCILLSPSQYPLSPAGLQFVGTWILRRGGTFLLRYIRKQSADHPEQMLRVLLGATRHVCTIESLASEGSGNSAFSSALKCTRTVLLPYLKDAGLPSIGWRCFVLPDDYSYSSNDWSIIFKRASLSETVQWLADLLIQELELHGIERLSSEVVQEAVTFLFPLYAIASVSDPDVVVLAMLPFMDRVLACGGRSKEHLQSFIWCYVSQPVAFIQSYYQFPQKFLDQVNEETLGELYQAVVAILNDISPELNRPSFFARLCYTVIHILRRCVGADSGWAINKNCNLTNLRLWRRIFRRITASLPPEGLPTDGPIGRSHKQLIAICFSAIDWISKNYWHLLRGYTTPVYLANNPKRRIEFKPEESPFSHHFVFALSKLLPVDARGPFHFESWRLQMVESMSEEERLVAVTDDEHDDDEGEPFNPVARSGPPSNRDPSLNGSEPGGEDEQSRPQMLVGELGHTIGSSEGELGDILPQNAVGSSDDLVVQVGDEAPVSLDADLELHQVAQVTLSRPQSSQKGP